MECVTSREALAVLGPMAAQVLKLKQLPISRMPTHPHARMPPTTAALRRVCRVLVSRLERVALSWHPDLHAQLCVVVAGLWGAVEAVVLSQQRVSGQHCDVTLVSDDGFLAKAHRSVLSAASQYMARVLGDLAPDQHPTVVLRGASYAQILCLLDFMYLGNLQVQQSEVEGVLEVADLLAVRGLSGIRTNPAIQKFMVNPSPPQPPDTPPPPTNTPTNTPTNPPPPPNPPQPPTNLTNPISTEEIENEGKDLSPSHVNPSHANPTHPNPSHVNPPTSPSNPTHPNPPQTSGIDLSMGKSDLPKEDTGVVAAAPPPPTAREGGEVDGVEGGEPPPPPPPPPQPQTPRKRRKLEAAAGCKYYVCLCERSLNNRVDKHVLWVNLLMVLSFVTFWTPYALTSVVSIFRDDLGVFWYVFPTVLPRPPA